MLLKILLISITFILDIGGYYLFAFSEKFTSYLYWNISFLILCIFLIFLNLSGLVFPFFPLGAHVIFIFYVAAWMIATAYNVIVAQLRPKAIGLRRTMKFIIIPVLILYLMYAQTVMLFK